MISDRARRWAVYVVLATLFAVACGFLSHWQFSRNEERAAANTLIERNYDAPVVPLDSVIDAAGNIDPSHQWRPITVTGHYLPEEQLLVRNRPQGGTSAFEVIVPLVTNDGHILVIDRGWLPPSDTSDRPDAVPAAPTGEVTVTARLRPGEPLPSSGRSAPDGQLPTIHLPSVAAVAGPQTITSAYGVLVSESPRSPTPHALAAPEIDPGPNLSYAVQWILFAIMGFVFIGYMIRTEVRARREDEEDDEDDSPPRAPHVPFWRRDSDAEVEDALLDAPR